MAETVIVLPRRLADEIAEELSLARRALTYDSVRVAALEELLETVSTLAACVRHDVTLTDLVATSGSPVERARRRQLIRALRLPRAS